MPKMKELKSYHFIASGACSYKNYLNDACHVGATFGCEQGSQNLPFSQAKLAPTGILKIYGTIFYDGHRGPSHQKTIQKL
jgi:hypothetical protein